VRVIQQRRKATRTFAQRRSDQTFPKTSTRYSGGGGRSKRALVRAKRGNGKTKELAAEARRTKAGLGIR
jgi:hypothetical protein